MPSGKSLAYGIAAVTAVTLGAVTAMLVLSPGTTSMDSATVLSEPRPLPEFALLDQDGAPFTRESLRGHWSLVFAGFTACPDVCPTTLALLKQVRAGLAAPPQVVFLSVDPQRDTPQRLRDYVQYFDKSFTGVTAAEPALAAAAQGFGIAYAKIPGTSPDDYTMDHSAMLILVDPQARIAAYFLPPLVLDTLESDLSSIMEGKS